MTARAPPFIRFELAFHKHNQIKTEENMRIIQYTLDEIKDLNEYDFNAFTKEDRLTYQPILEKEPYDWELMDFFYKQYRAERLFRRNLSHYISKDVFYDVPM